MKTAVWMKIITLLLLALWVPVLVDKLIDYGSFKAGMLRQPLPSEIIYTLLWLLPFTEGLIVALLLINSKTRRWAMYLSLISMLIFTVYIGLALLGFWEKVPCVCGSVIRFLTWKQHFFFNLFYVFLSGWGVFLTRRTNHLLCLEDTKQMGKPTKLAAIHNH